MGLPWFRHLQGFCSSQIIPLSLWIASLILLIGNRSDTSLEDSFILSDSTLCPLQTWLQRTDRWAQLSQSVSLFCRTIWVEERKQYLWSLLRLTMRVQEMNKADLWGEHKKACRETKMISRPGAFLIRNPVPYMAQKCSKPCYWEIPKIVPYIISIKHSTFLCLGYSIDFYNLQSKDSN